MIDSQPGHPTNPDPAIVDPEVVRAQTGSEDMWKVVKNFCASVIDSGAFLGDICFASISAMVLKFSKKAQISFSKSRGSTTNKIKIHNRG